MLATAMKCIRPVLLAGASLGADAASTLPDDGPEFDFYKFLEGIGVRIYVEARPREAAPGWSRSPVASMDDWWIRSDPERYPSSARLTNCQLEGGVVRILNDLRGASSEPEDVQEAITRIRHALLEGHTVVFRGDGMRAAGVTIDQLVEGIDEALGVDPNAGSRIADGDAPSASDPGAASRQVERMLKKPGVSIEINKTGTKRRNAGPSSVIRSGDGSDGTFRPYVRTRSRGGARRARRRSPRTGPG